jgi:hypothetical protein
VVGFVVVAIGIFVFNFLLLIVWYLLNNFDILKNDFSPVTINELLRVAWFRSVKFFDFGPVGSFSPAMAPAFIIHLWLPLFAFSSLAVRLVFLIFRAVEWAQWSLKQGDAHPLRAIGIVATIHSLWKRNAGQRSMDAPVR